MKTAEEKREVFKELLDVYEGMLLHNTGCNAAECKAVCEDWLDDYDAITEPLIKDENIRRAVLMWSSTYNESRDKEVRCIQYRQATELIATSNCLARITLPVIPELLDLNEYTIEELCGEEGE